MGIGRASSRKRDDSLRLSGDLQFSISPDYDHYFCASSYILFVARSHRQGAAGCFLVGAAGYFSTSGGVALGPGLAWFPNLLGRANIA